LLTEHAAEDDPTIVLDWPLLLAHRSKIVAHQLVVIFHRQDEAGAQQKIELGGRNIPGLLRPQRIGLADQPAIFVEEYDRGTDGFISDRFARDASEPFADLVQLAPVELAADIVFEILRQIDVA